jgi:hypothetical protein
MVGQSMPNSSKSRDQAKCSPWSSRLRVGRWLRTPPRKNLLLRNHGGGQESHRVVAPVKKKKKKKKKKNVVRLIHIYFI